MQSSKISSTTEENDDKMWDEQAEVYDHLYNLRGCSWREALVIAYGVDVYVRLLKMKRPKDYERIRELYE